MCVSFAMTTAAKKLWGPHNAIAAKRTTVIMSTVMEVSENVRTQSISKKSQLLNESEDMSWMPRQ